MTKGVRWHLCSSAFSVINCQKHSWISLPRTLPSPALKGQLKQAGFPRQHCCPAGWANRGHFTGTWRKGFLCQIVPLCYLWVSSFRVRPQNPFIWLWFCVLAPTSSKVESCVLSLWAAGVGRGWRQLVLGTLVSVCCLHLTKITLSRVWQKLLENHDHGGMDRIQEEYLCPSGSRRGSDLPGQESQVGCWAWFHLKGSEVAKWIYLLLGWLWGCLSVLSSNCMCLWVHDCFSLKSVSCLHKKCGQEALCRLCTAFREKNSEMHSQIPVSWQHCHGTCIIT